MAKVRAANARIILEAQGDVRGPQNQNRDAASMGQMLTFVQASIFGKYVSEEIRQERETRCETCPYKRVDDAGIPWCAICGCGTSNVERQIRNLAAYEENLPYWGCKHPQRHEGAGWRR